MSVEIPGNGSTYVWKKPKYFFGKNKEGENIYLSMPNWDCEWYWGFGYLGNRNCHYHLSGFAEGRNINMYDALKADYELCTMLQKDKNLWTFCELVKTAYALKETAEVLDRGGSHYTTNPCKDLIKNEAEVIRLNSVVLPAIFRAIEDLFVTQEKEALRLAKLDAEEAAVERELMKSHLPIA